MQRQARCTAGFFWVDNDPRDDSPLGTYALPVEYDKLEKRMVPQDERDNPKYGGFYFYFKTVDLNNNFALIQTGFDGKASPRLHGTYEAAPASPSIILPLIEILI